MLDVIEKPWGVTRCIHRSATCEVWHASIRQGKGSSRHRHLSKHNDFYVVSGVLEVDLGSMIVTLNDGDRLSVPAGQWHRFYSGSQVELIETYWLADINPNDIERQVEPQQVWVG